MNAKLIDSIANAVLYEGYMLYPYRPSSVKNQQRWNFGVVYPKPYSEKQKGTDICVMQTQCLMRGGESSEIEIRVRFLHCIARKIGKLRTPELEFSPISETDFEVVESLRIGGKEFGSWQEAAEREVLLGPVRLADLLHTPHREVFSFPGGQELEPSKDDSGKVEALIVRRHEPIGGSVELSAVNAGNGVFRLSVVLSNLTDIKDPDEITREDALLKCLLSAHTILGITGGEFISQIDPPPELQLEASQCTNLGTWPVMVGDESARDSMLSSPIILYDYPQIAPESQGNLFDGTEIDEILALRILTLSDDEKHEIRQSDARAREVLERTESMPAEQFMKLHGVLRGMTPADSSANAELAREEER
jgi:hydrogenase maturation protease